MIKLTAPAAREVATRYAVARNTADIEFRTSMDDAGRFTLQILRRKVNVKTGKLRDSMQYKLEKTSSGYCVKFVADAKAVSDGGYYVNHVDQGAVPHTIIARNKRCLHFFDRNGNERFVQAVYHPGYVGSKFSNRSVAEATRHADVLAKRYLQSISRKVSG